MANYYDTLGIPKSADEKQIRQAYRKLARKYHPDLNPGDKGTDTIFREINEAYEVLSDSDKRKRYDRYGENWKQADRIEAQHGDIFGSSYGGGFRTGRRRHTSGSDPFAGLGDLLGNLGGRPGGRGGAATMSRVEGQIEVTLEEAFSGSKRQVTLTTPQGERRLEVTIPPGVDTGSVVRISPGKGQEVLLNVTVLPHQRFVRKGSALYVDQEIPMEDALLGGEVEVQTLKGRVHLKVPPESQNGGRIRLSSRGMPVLGSKDERGDLYVVIRPKIPKGLSDEERELVQRFKELRSGER